MEIILKTPPALEPVTLDETRAFLRLSDEQERDTLPTLIAAGRAHVESLTGRALLKQEWQMTLKPPYPPSSPLVRMGAGHVRIQLPKPPLISVESVKLGEKDIPFTQEENKVILSPQFWNEMILINYWAGYGETAADLPPDLKMAVLMVIRCLYDDRPVDTAFLRPFRVLGLL